eukprot:3059860-Amphidinium_carterae.1
MELLFAINFLCAGAQVTSKNSKSFFQAVCFYLHPKRLSFRLDLSDFRVEVPLFPQGGKTVCKMAVGNSQDMFSLSELGRSSCQQSVEIKVVQLLFS